MFKIKKIKGTFDRFYNNPGYEILSRYQEQIFFVYLFMSTGPFIWLIFMLKWDSLCHHLYSSQIDHALK